MVNDYSRGFPPGKQVITSVFPGVIFPTCFLLITTGLFSGFHYFAQQCSAAFNFPTLNSCQDRASPEISGDLLAMPSEVRDDSDKANAENRRRPRRNLGVCGERPEANGKRAEVV